MDCYSGTILNIKPSNNTAIIYDNGVHSLRLSYSDFVTKSTELTEELETVLHDGKEGVAKLYVGISSDVTLNLPIVVYSLMRTGHVFVPISIPDTSPARWKFYTENSLKWMLLPKYELNLLRASTKEKYFAQTHPLKCLTDYVIVKLPNLLNSMTSSSTWPLSKDILYVVQSSGTTGEPKIISVLMDCILPNVHDLR